jgi:hypothetical protein
VLALTAALLLTGSASAATASSTGLGNDISYPQCISSTSASLPPAGGSFGIVGVNGGKAFTQNACLQPEFAWAAGLSDAPGFYVNTGNPGKRSAHWNNPGAPLTCSGKSNDANCAYDYGWNAAVYAYSYAQSVTASPRQYTFWFDVETANSWNTGNTSTNVADLHGMLDYLKSRGAVYFGFYSTRSQWNQIIGGAQDFNTYWNWVAGASDLNSAQKMCDSVNSFTGGPVKLSQYISGGFDTDYRCY